MTMVVEGSEGTCAGSRAIAVLHGMSRICFLVVADSAPDGKLLLSPPITRMLVIIHLPDKPSMLSPPGL